MPYNEKQQKRSSALSLTLKLWNLALITVMCGQMTAEATKGSPHSLKVATFKTLPLSEVLFTEDLLWEKPARSRIECNVMCRGDARCVMITFQPGGVTGEGPRELGTCRSHWKRKSPRREKTVGVAGSRSFNLVADPWIKKHCYTNGDCPELQAACFSYQCLCDGGYFFDYTLNACMKSCTRRLGNKYVVYMSRDLFGYKMYDQHYSDPNSCLTRCNADPKCVTITRWIDMKHCYFKYITVQDFPAPWKAASGYNFYQRTCN